MGWKLNPEAPWRRTTLGFDTTDYALDAVISPDLTWWRWKDEEEFVQAVELGLIPSRDAEAIRDLASELVTEALTTLRSQLEQCAAWRPPSDWTTPALVDGWADL